MPSFLSFYLPQNTSSAASSCSLKHDNMEVFFFVVSLFFVVFFFTILNTWLYEKVYVKGVLKSLQKQEK